MGLLAARNYMDRAPSCLLTLSYNILRRLVISQPDKPGVPEVADLRFILHLFFDGCPTGAPSYVADQTSKALVYLIRPESAFGQRNLRRYSALSATTGSTLAARRAGI